MASMPEENKKVLNVVNVNTHATKAASNPNYEIQLGCGCGAASCQGCPGSMGIKPGSEKDVVYRNVSVYLLIAIAIILGTFVVQRILSVLSGGLS